MMISVTLGIVFVLVGNSLAIECPTNFTQLGTGCYFFSTRADTFLNSVKECQAMHSNIVSIESSQESDAINAHIKELSQNGDTLFWIGGTNYFDQNRWVWLPSFKTFDFNDWCGPGPAFPPSMFPPPPNNVGGDQHCVFTRIIDGNPCWDDYECNQSSWAGIPTRYICEYQPKKECIPICCLERNSGHCFE